jgi:hypothetical protein
MRARRGEERRFGLAAWPGEEKKDLLDFGEEPDDELVVVCSVVGEVRRETNILLRVSESEARERLRRRE